MEPDNITGPQAKLSQTERLAAIGQHVAKVAHEINNPLTSILMTSSLALAEMQADNPMRSDMEVIRETTEHLRAILGNVLDFSRPVQYYLEDIDISAVASDSARIFQPRMESQGVHLFRELSGTLTVLADKHWLAQVFANLISNALDTMPGGGRLTIRTGREGGEALAQVIDTGAGIAPSAMSRLFEPFFTTKRNGRGVGLGLAISRNVVTELGGSLHAASEPGRGSTFTVRLPLLLCGEEKRPVRCSIVESVQQGGSGNGNNTHQLPQ